MPVGTSQMASVVLDDKIVVIGGWLISTQSPYTTVQIYDPQTDIWTTEADTPFLRAGFSAEVVRGRIFAIGGTNRSHPCPATSTVFECNNGFIIPELYDFNADKIVDSADMCIMIDHWGEDYWLCDVFSDGIIDIRDMVVFAEYLFDKALPVDLAAYWKLDETEGSAALDSAGDNDAFVIGGPSWQPNGGVIDGALELDGVDDCVITNYILNPADGPFRVFAWIKGGAPGQVVLSQMGGVNWLGIDPSEGHLITELAGPSLDSGPLYAQTMITDGNWHRIGFVWDGSHRTLYVDDVVAAKDAQDGLAGPSNGLYIGCGKTMQPGTYFSGVIDDIRIYNRAVRP
jgi:hypothetical protein